MIIEVSIDKDDDEAFMTAMNGLIANLVAEYCPKLFFIIRIDKWFDHKWLRFSGMGRVGLFGLGKITTDTAIEPFWQPQLTFPPFNPKHVSFQIGWQRVSDCNYKRLESDKRPHQSTRGRSAANLQNRVHRFTDSGLFIWFSSHSKSNQRGSIMVYQIQDSSEEAWYASFGRFHAWRVGQVKGIERELLQTLFPLG